MTQQLLRIALTFILISSGCIITNCHNMPKSAAMAVAARTVQVNSFDALEKALEEASSSSSQSSSNQKVSEIIVTGNIPTLKRTLRIRSASDVHIRGKLQGGRRRIGSSDSPAFENRDTDVFRIESGATLKISDIDLRTSDFRQSTLANRGGKISEVDNVRFIGYGDAMLNRDGGEIEKISRCVFDRNTKSASGAYEQVRNLQSGSIGTITLSEFKQVSFGGGIANRGSINEIRDVKFMDNPSGSNDDPNARSVRSSAIDSYGSIGKLEFCEFTNVMSSSNGAGIQLQNFGSIGEIKDCKFSNCHARGSGGGIYAQGKISKMHKVKFEGCTADASRIGGGGGISVPGGSIENLSNVQFENCIAKARGGGLYADQKAEIGTTAPLSRLAFRKCEASSGGAIALRSARIVSPIDESEFTENQGSIEAGAIAGDTDALLEGVSKSTFQGNKAARGGAISMDARSTIGNTGIRDNIFRKNVATSFLGGGAMFVFSPSGFSIIGNRFTGNRAFNGGALRLYLGVVINEISDNIFDENEANNFAAAIMLNGQITTMDGNVFRQNKAGIRGGGIYLDDGTIQRISNSVFYRNSERAIHNEIGQIFNIDDCYFVDNEGVALQNHNVLRNIRRGVFVGDQIRQFGNNVNLFGSAFAQTDGSTLNDRCVNSPQTKTKCPNCPNCRNGEVAAYCSMVKDIGALDAEGVCGFLRPYGCQFDKSTNTCVAANGEGTILPPPISPTIKSDILDFPTPSPSAAPTSVDQFCSSIDSITKVQRRRKRCVKFDRCMWTKAGKSCLKSPP